MDDAVWDWIKKLLCDPVALDVGLKQMVESRANQVTPMQKQLEAITGLIEEEELIIKRLITEMGKHDDNFILETLRNEIDLVTKNHKSL